MIPSTINFLIRKRGVIAGTLVGGVSSISALITINLEKDVTKTSMANLIVNPLVGFAVGRSLFIGSPSLFAAIASHFNNLRNHRVNGGAWPHDSYTRLCMASLRSGAKLGAVVGIGYHYLAFVGMYFLGKIGRTDKEYVELMRGCAASFVPCVVGGAAIGSVGTTAVVGIGASRLLW